MKTIHISKIDLTKGVFMIYNDNHNACHRLCSDPYTGFYFYTNIHGDKSGTRTFETLEKVISELDNEQKLYQIKGFELFEITDKIIVSIKELKACFSKISKVDTDKIVIRG